MVAMLAGMLARVPCRVHYFTGQVWATRNGWVRYALKTIDRVLVWSATNLLADSPSQKFFLGYEGVVPINKICVLGVGSICGVDVLKYQSDIKARNEIRQQLGVAETDQCILFVGRLTEEKGVPDLVEAFNCLLSRYPQLKLILVGPDEGGLAQRWANVRGVFHIGYTQSVAAYMAASEILCLPSYREGFGSVLIEAGACELPVVASRIYGIQDAVRDGKTGLLHTPRDVNDLAEKIERLLSSPKMRTLMGSSARREVIENFSQNQICLLFGEYIKQLLHQQPTSGS